MMIISYSKYNAVALHRGGDAFHASACIPQSRRPSIPQSRRPLVSPSLALLLLLLVAALHPAIAATPMRGVYTIGRGGDFRTIGGAFRALERRGIDRAVRLRVHPGTYREILRLGRVPGGLASRRVTLEPVTPGARVLVTLPSRADSIAPLLSLDGASDLTISGLSLHAFGPRRSAVIRIIRSSRITIERNSITGERAGLARPDFTRGIHIVDADTMITIRGNRIGGMHYGVSGGNAGVGQGSRNSLIDLVVEGNHLSDLYCMGIQLFKAPAVVIRRNRISLESSYGPLRGIEVTGCSSAVMILGNRIDLVGTAGTGISFQFSGVTAGRSALIANNVIRNQGVAKTIDQTQTGIDVYGAGSVDVMHNTVRLTTRPASDIYVRKPVAFSMNPASNRRTLVINNIFSTERGFAVWPVESFRWGFEDYNLLHSNAGSISFRYPESFHTPATWPTTGRDRHSVYADPRLDSSIGMRAPDSLVRGRGRATVVVTTDIDGRTRHPFHPDIGAHESSSYRGRRPYRPMLGSPRQWRYAYIARGAADTIRFRTTDETKYLFDQMFTKLVASPDFLWFDTSFDYVAGALREDAIGRVFLAREHKRYIHGFTERLLYDFRARQGDTLDVATRNIDSTERVIVARVDSVRIGGHYRRRLLIRLAYSDSTWTNPVSSTRIIDEWIEGIGGLRSLPAFAWKDSLRRGELLCLRENDRAIYGASCRERPSDLRLVSFYRRNGRPRVEVIDSMVHLIVAPEQEYTIFVQDTLESVTLDRHGRGPAILSRLDAFPRRAIYWSLMLSNGRAYSGWIRRPE